MTNNSNTQLTEAFKLLESGLNGLTDSAFHKERKEAMHLFNDVGFPHAKHEEYKYLNLRKLLAEELKLASKDKTGKVNLEDFDIPQLDAYTIVFVDGFLSKQHKSDSFYDKGLLITSVQEAQSGNIELLNETFEAYKNKKNNPFALLNSAMAQDGAFIYLEKNSESDKPVHIVHINSGNQPESWVQPTHIISLEDNSELTVVQSFFSPDKSCKDNAATILNVGNDARLHVYTHQDIGSQASHINTVYGNAFRNSTVSTYSFVRGGGLVRNNVELNLKDHYGDAHMYGLYVPNGREIVDNHTVVDHQIADCESNELYKGVMLDRSIATFNGKIFVRQDAQKTNAFQSNRNLVVSDNAVINTKPQLEIWADDVRCTHGATIGQLNQDEIYYLNSRGIPTDKAKAILKYAFVGDVLQYFKLDEYREFCKNQLAEKLDFGGLNDFIEE